ncbi:hypothetical protein KVC81_06940 [Helicobacter pylori]|nr:hypothetical protein KVE78_06920 [Helicobacter pylori]WQR99169.1 hypothetical protein KVC81_06940 [Helicobacter pylori]WQS02869.1 hypothetical protein KVD22_06920 [Helicobacter pylori]
MKTEKEVQKQVIETFKTMGYAYLGDLTKSDNENINKESLKAWLIKNQKISDERLFEVFTAHQTCRCVQFLCSMFSFSLFPYWALGLCLVVYGFVFNSVSMKCWL